MNPSSPFAPRLWRVLLWSAQDLIRAIGQAVIGGVRRHALEVTKGLAVLALFLSVAAVNALMAFWFLHSFHRPSRLTFWGWVETGLMVTLYWALDAIRVRRGGRPMIDIDDWTLPFPLDLFQRFGRWKSLPIEVFFAVHLWAFGLSALFFYAGRRVLNVVRWVTRSVSTAWRGFSWQRWTAEVSARHLAERDSSPR